MTSSHPEWIVWTHAAGSDDIGTEMWPTECGGRTAYAEAVEDVRSGDILIAALIYRNGADWAVIGAAWDEDAPKEDLGPLVMCAARAPINSKDVKRYYYYVTRADGMVAELVGPWETFVDGEDIWGCIEVMFPACWDLIDPDMIEVESFKMRCDDRFRAGIDDYDLKDWLIEGQENIKEAEE